MALKVDQPHASVASAQKHLPTFAKFHSSWAACQRCLLKSREVNLPKKRLIHVLVAILTCMSIVRLLRFAITMYPSPAGYAISPDLKRNNNQSSKCQHILPHDNATVISMKEFTFLSKLIYQKSPCNLLIFGPQKQYQLLSRVNAAGTTVILEDGTEKLKKTSDSTTIYKVKYKTAAKKAYEMLKHARAERTCAPDSEPLKASTCKLALTDLPRKVYETKWDVIVVDDPVGDELEAPGRMSTIYTASLMARAGNITDVVVHDMNRMIERWFSWEFLCQENLVSSKGKFSNFRIKGTTMHKSKTFCSQW